MFFYHALVKQDLTEVHSILLHTGTSFHKLSHFEIDETRRLLVTNVLTRTPFTFQDQASLAKISIFPAFLLYRLTRSCTACFELIIYETILSSAGVGQDLLLISLDKQKSKWRYQQLRASFPILVSFNQVSKR